MSAAIRGHRATGLRTWQQHGRELATAGPADRAGRQPTRGSGEPAPVHFWSAFAACAFARAISAAHRGTLIRCSSSCSLARCSWRPCWRSPPVASHRAIACGLLLSSINSCLARARSLMQDSLTPAAISAFKRASTTGAPLTYKMRKRISVLNAYTDALANAAERSENRLHRRPPAD